MNRGLDPSKRLDRIRMALRRRWFLWRYDGTRYTEAQKAAIRLRAKGRL